MIRLCRLGEALSFDDLIRKIGELEQRLSGSFPSKPDSEDEALKVAKTFNARIDTIYVGPENGDGRDFLKRLASASGGQGDTAAQVKELAATVENLLLTA